VGVPGTELTTGAGTGREGKGVWVPSRLLLQEGGEELILVLSKQNDEKMKD
jgi:hypothetical protein